MNAKILGILAVFLVGVLAFTGIAAAIPTVSEVKIDGNVVPPSAAETIEVERGNDFSVQVKLTASANESNVEVSAYIVGYEYSDYERVSDTSHLFDMTSGDTVYKKLTLKLPDNLGKDYYDMRVSVAGRTGTAFEGLYRLHVKDARHSITIRDLILTPSTEVTAGRLLTAKVRVKNVGENTETDVNIKVEIPSLSVSGNDYIDEVEKDESETSEEIEIRIPECAASGTYTVKATAAYDDGYEKVSEEKQIKVSASPLCSTASTAVEGQTLVSFSMTAQEVERGESVLYPITITNAGNAAKTYVVSVDGLTGWATSAIKDSNVVVLQSGEAKTVYAQITADDDAKAEEHTAVLKVSSGSDVKETSIKATVKAVSASGFEKLKEGLKIGLIALVVILVIIGAIVIFTKSRRKDEGSEEEATQTYY
ncbi:MAG: hypothetical protein Q7J54_02940 [Candidatus Woesearchaeota archaeon]|nr:hypothetical protein [Candidatus Woesearchaeota archaeon]